MPKKAKKPKPIKPVSAYSKVIEDTTIAIAKVLQKTYDPAITSHTVMRVCLDNLFEEKWTINHYPLKEEDLDNLVPFLAKLMNTPSAFGEMNNNSLRYRNRLTKPIILAPDEPIYYPHQ